jgi:hypothetical protein
MGKIDTTTRLIDLYGVTAEIATSKVVQDFHERLARVALDAMKTYRFVERQRERIPPAVTDIDIDDLDKVGDVAELDGIPLGWVPSIELVRELIELPDTEARFTLLHARRAEICEHCVDIAESRAVLWMPECAEAALVLRNGHPAAAQSLAANVIDTILRAVAAQGVKLRPRKPLDPDSPIIVEGERVVIKPLISAMREWRPKSGVPIPVRFSRHVTAHGMGYPGSTDETKALIAVMLATSMARQFGRPAAELGQA